MLIYMIYLRLLALRHAVTHLLRSLRPPRAQIPSPEPLLNKNTDPATVRKLLEESEQERRELLEMSKSLDRKLLAVITAGGVYAALLISVRGVIPGPAAGMAGLLAVVGMLLAYLAWRPNPLPAMTTQLLAEQIHTKPDLLNLFLVAVHNSLNHQIYDINNWKERVFVRASNWVAVSAVITLLSSILGGLL